MAGQRADTGRKWARKVVRDHDAVVEDFRPKFLARTTMARKAADAAIGATKAALIEMGRKHGRDIRLVHPAHTTMASWSAVPGGGLSQESPPLSGRGGFKCRNRLAGESAPAELTGRKSGRRSARCCPRPRDPEQVIGLVGLEAKADRRTTSLSGGRRRLDVALGVIGDLDLLLLNEPTIGFDPAAPPPVMGPDPPPSRPRRRFS